MPTTKFERISNWSKKGPVIEIVFEILDPQNKSIGTHRKKVLFDSGNNNGIVLSSMHIDEFGLNASHLYPIEVSSPNAVAVISQFCYVIINEINVGKNNILERPMKNKISLIFSTNEYQTPIIGQVPFMDYECCINYKRETFSITRQ